MSSQSFSMNKAVVVDSSAIVSLASLDDSNHKKAREIIKLLQNNQKVLVLPSEIFTETLNVTGKKMGRKKQLEVGKDLLSGSMVFIETEDKIRKTAFDKLKKSTPSTSFTDCLVMAIADSLETREIFGFDEVFKKQGYLRIGLDNV